WLRDVPPAARPAPPPDGAARRAQDRGSEASGIGRAACRVQRLRRACGRRRGEGGGLLARRFPVGAAEARRAPALGQGSRSLLPILRPGLATGSRRLGAREWQAGTAAAAAAQGDLGREEGSVDAPPL